MEDLLCKVLFGNGHLLIVYLITRVVAVGSTGRNTLRPEMVADLHTCGGLEESTGELPIATEGRKRRQRTGGGRGRGRRQHGR